MRFGLAPLLTNNPHSPMPPHKLVPLVIWFAILMGLFIILEFAGGGLATLNIEVQLSCPPLILLGFLPLVVAAIARAIIIPKAKTQEQFLQRFIIALALCEGVAIISMFVVSSEFAAEKAFTFISSVIAIVVLCPLFLPQPSHD